MNAGPFLCEMQRVLASRRVVAYAAIAAVVLTLPSLGVGLLMDDYFHQLVITRQELFADAQRSPIDIFRFLSGDAAHTQRLMDVGLVPWWTWPSLRAAFWRPVTGATHWLDYQLWPGWPALMHAQNLLWYGLLAGAVGLLYRRVMGPTWVAGLAALLYAVDDAHGMPVGWVANRNAVLAAFFGVCTILTHIRWRQERSRLAGFLAPLLLTVALLSAEAGIAACAYLLAYAALLERGRWFQRLASLVPCGLVVVVWRAAWSWKGYGVTGLGLYTDPLSEPGTFLIDLAWKAPLLALGQWVGVPSELTIFMSGRTIWLFAAAAIVVLALLSLVLVPVLRRCPTAGFWAAGMLLSLLPIAATFPSDRLLFFVGIGAMGLLALFLHAVVENRSPWPTRAVAGTLAVIHLAISPVLLPVRSGFPTGPRKAAEALYVRTQFDSAVQDQAVVIVNAPSAAHAHYLPVVRTLRGSPVPKQTRVLAPAVPALKVDRIDERSLLVTAEHGYLTFPFDRLFRTPEHALEVGEVVRTAGMTAEVTRLTPDGRPFVVLFRFDVPLEGGSLRWLRYDNGEFVPFTPPSLGESVVLEADWPW